MTVVPRASKDDCKIYLEALQQGVDGERRDKIFIIEPFLKRNILFFSWMKGPVLIELNELVNHIDPSDAKVAGRIYQILRDEFAPYILVGEQDAFVETFAFRLTSEMLEAANEVFNSKKYRFNIDQYLPYFTPHLRGMRLIHKLNGLGGENIDNSGLAALIAKALKEALGNRVHIADVNLNVASDTKNVPGFKVIECVDQKWRFLLGVVASSHALANEDVFRITSFISAIANSVEEPNLPTLLFIPNIHNSSALNYLKQYFPNVHLIWTLSLLRFFHDLHEHTSEYSGSLYRVFMSVFLDQGTAFSSNLALQNIQNRLSSLILFVVNDAPGEDGESVILKSTSEGMRFPLLDDITHNGEVYQWVQSIESNDNTKIDLMHSMIKKSAVKHYNNSQFRWINSRDLDNQGLLDEHVQLFRAGLYAYQNAVDLPEPLDNQKGN